MTSVADIAVLQAEIEQLRAALQASSAELAEAAALRQALQARVEVAESAAKRLQADMARLKRMIFGRKSERVVDVDQIQLPWGPDPAPAADDDGEDTATTDGEQQPPKRRKKNRRNKRRDISKMNHLPTIEDISPVEDRQCPCGCGAPAEHIGFDVSWRLERVPGYFERHKNSVEKVAFPGHLDRATRTVVTASPRKAYALPKAMCGNGLLVQVLIDKYCDHMPLYRQEARFRRQGMDLSRSTLCGWVMESAELFAPIVRWMGNEVLSGTWLRIDGTGQPVLDSKRTKGQAHLGHMWAWGNYDTVVFSYTPDKKMQTVGDLLPGYEGVILADGASEFNLIASSPDVTRAGCWAHARRRFYEALAEDAELAMRGLTAIRQLFLAERIVMAAPVEDRLRLRAELSQPVIEGIRQWVDRELPEAIPRSACHRALGYIDRQWDRLCVFLRVAEIACHNNDTERDLRRPVKGKHNFLFAGSPRGANAAAVLYSLIGTCLLQGIDPRRYLLEICGRLDEPARALTPQAVRQDWLDAQPGTTLEPSSPPASA